MEADGQKDGKRKRKPNSRYMTSPPAKKRKRAGRPKKKSAVGALESFGSMLKTLVVDEIGLLGRDLMKEKGGEQLGSGGSSGAGAIKGKDKKAALVKLGVYSDDEDEGDEPASHEQPADLCEKEVMRYCLEKNESKLPVLEWWMQNEVRFPILAKVARRNLAVQATSSESERDFSAAGLVASKQRLSLSPESMNICTFCSINKKWVPMKEPASN